VIEMSHCLVGLLIKAQCLPADFRPPLWSTLLPGLISVVSARSLWRFRSTHQVVALRSSRVIPSTNWGPSCSWPTHTPRFGFAQALGAIRFERHYGYDPVPELCVRKLAFVAG
jgi:hypothetical protein